MVAGSWIHSSARTATLVPLDWGHLQAMYAQERQGAAIRNVSNAVLALKGNT
jgi:hypothetical protein